MFFLLLQVCELLMISTSKVILFFFEITIFISSENPRHLHVNIGYPIFIEVRLSVPKLDLYVSRPWIDSARFPIQSRVRMRIQYLLAWDYHDPSVSVCRLSASVANNVLHRSYEIYDAIFKRNFMKNSLGYSATP